ncbi:DUF4352 domain-containing protein [Actinoplanes sp. NPDC049548]|uniref:DUF4352 domain-containing protein n=1 Tax=Actinoplanes sp. NPDC049548 TaxID=3155152 RepID=UPI003437EEC2
MTGPGNPTAVSSSCPSCGAGMEVDHEAGVMRCPYCRREVLMPASQAAQTGWPFGAPGASIPQITISTKAFTQPPEVVRRQKVAAAILGVGMLVAAGAVLVPVLWSGSSSSSLNTSLGAVPTEQVKEVAVGATTKVQAFEATVRSVDCTKKAITKKDDPATSFDDTMTEKAKGKFCVVSFSVKNVGAKTDSYPTWGLEATSPTERVLYRNTLAESYVNKESDNLGQPIDPGKTVDQRLVYDVPADTKLAYLKIYDGMLSDSTIKVKF